MNPGPRLAVRRKGAVKKVSMRVLFFAQLSFRDRGTDDFTSVIVFYSLSHEENCDNHDHNYCAVGDNSQVNKRRARSEVDKVQKTK